VFEMLAQPMAYPGWWPGTTGSGSHLFLPGIGRVSWQEDGVQPDVELTLRVEGRGVRGRVQWYLEPFKEGTVVYGIVDLEADRALRPRRQRAIRAGVHGALFALKDLLE
jgi:hypothetical protein